VTSAERANAGPLVTIGISTYNRAESTLPEALDSALRQTYGALEVIVCDNASTDGTEALLRARRDPRLAFHRHAENIGANANFNACLERARGRFFLLLHDDDVLDETFVERAMTALEGRDPGVLLAGVRLIDAEGHGTGLVSGPPDGLTPSDLFLRWFERRFSFYLVSTLFHTERLRAAGGFASPEDLFQDVVAIARLAGRHGYVAVPGIGGSFRRHEMTRTKRSPAMRWARDANYLLDAICAEMPQAAAALRAAGAPYFTATCYRYVATEPSWWQRRAMYAHVYRLFGRTLPLWRHRARTLQRRLARRVRRVTDRRPTPRDAGRTP